MPTYLSFAIVGAGGIGGLIIDALLSKGVKVVVLTRSSGRTFSAGAAVEEVDYESLDSISGALQKHKVEVVISTLGFGGFNSQSIVAEAAKASGVKLFVPSEYGMPTEGSTEGMLGHKNEFAKYLKYIGLPSARFFVGFFTGEVTWLTGYEANGKINIVGKGESPISFTAEEDIAGFIAHVLTELPSSVSQDKIFRIEGDRYTFKQLAEVFKTEAAHVESIPGSRSEITTMLHQHIELGFGSTGRDVTAEKEGKESAGSSNSLWDGHHWKTIKEVHGL